MKTLFCKLSLVSACLLLGASAYAKTFSNQFIEFQLPEKWECALDGTEWVCQSTDEQKKRDAIIVLAAKIKKPGMDELPIYKKHLQDKQIFTSVAGEKIESEPRYVKDLDISGKTWIDSLHLQSEIPDFYTRYLATVEADLGILVTFSVRKDKYEEYGPDVDAMVKSLRAFRKPGVLNESPAGEAGNANTGINTENIIFGTETGKKGGPAVAANKGNEEMMSGVLLLILLAAAGGFIYWRKKNKK